MKALGYEPVVAPLLAIRPIPQPEPAMDGIAALAFTSANGVVAFAALTDRRAIPVYAVGASTADAARQAGFADVQSADGAVADLARLLDEAAIDGVVLAPGAREPAADLPTFARRVTVRALPVYEAVATGANAPAQVDVVLLQSPRAGRALAALWPTLATMPVVVAQSAAIAQPLRALTTARVAAHPTETALLEALGNPPPGV